MIENENLEKYKKLTQQQHVLTRPTMYIGSTVTDTVNMWVANFIEDEIKISKKEIQYNPALLKIFDEAISNASDAYIRTKKVSYIKIDTSEKGFSVENDIEAGFGIPNEIHPTEKVYIGEMIFGHFMTGENYTDNREAAGVNGLGIKLLSCFSTNSYLEIADGKTLYKQKFRNNLSLIEPPVITSSKKSYVKITAEIDFSHFDNKTCIDEDTLSIMLKRSIDIAAYNPNLKIIFNGKTIRLKNQKEWMKMHLPTDCEFFVEDVNENWSVGVAKTTTDQFEQVSLATSVSTYRGGTHVNFVSISLSKEIADGLSRKIKANWADVKNKLFVFVICKIKNPSFDSQTKEYLINVMSKDTVGDFKFSDGFIKKILKSEIVASIVQALEAKENAELARLQKNNQKIKIDKFLDANGKDRTKCELFLFEGESAMSGFRVARDPQTQAGYMLRGKFTNITDISPKKILENKETSELMSIIGLKINTKLKKEDLRFSKILINCDKDVDGDNIVALLLNFFNLWPELYEWDVIYKNETPLLIVKTGKNKEFFYSQLEFDKYVSEKGLKNKKVSYKKGIGSLDKDEVSKMVKNPILIKMEKDNQTDDKLKIWFGSEADFRKKELLEIYG